jgi:hypothetical protein
MRRQAKITTARSMRSVHGFIRRGRALPRRSVRLIRRIPLLPLVTGACTVVVVATAIGSSQVSLTFTDEPPDHVGCIGPDCVAGDSPEAGLPPEIDPSGRASSRRLSSPRPALPASSSVPRPRAGEERTGGRVGRRPIQGGGSTPVTVAFRTAERWPGGYVGTATITNRGERPIRDWTLEFRVVEASVTYAWDVEVLRTGSHVVVRGRPEEEAIRPGGSVEIGFAADGAYHPPRGCRVNRTVC